MKSRTDQSRIAFFLLPVAILFVFFPVLGTDFAQDDYTFLFRAGQHTPSSLFRVFLPVEGPSFYRPQMDLYFTALYAVFDNKTVPFHLMALALIGVNAWLIACVGGQLGLNGWSRAVAAFFYGGHPTLMTIAMWPSAASSLLATFWTLLAVWSSLKWKGRLGGAIGSGLFCAGALTAREIGMALPVLLWLLLWAKEEAWRLGWKSALRSSLRTLRETVLCWMVLVFYLLLRWASLSQLTTETPYRIGGSFHILRNAEAVFLYSSGVMPSVAARIGALALALSIAFWAVLLWSVAKAERKQVGSAATGLFWFALGTAPLLLLTERPIAPYYLDWALPGLALTVGLASQTALRRWIQPRTVSLFAMSLICLFVRFSAASVRSERPQSPVLGQARRARKVVTNIKAVYPSLQPGTTIYLVGTDPAMRWATAFGDLFRVVYRDPSLKIEYVDDERAIVSGRSVIVFLTRDDGFVPLKADEQGGFSR